MADDKKWHDNGTCLHCGGGVDADGFAFGGDVEAPGGLDASMDGQLGDRMGQQTEQQESTVDMREAAFADALGSHRSRRGLDESTPKAPSAPLPGQDDDMARAKKQRYSFRGGR